MNSRAHASIWKASLAVAILASASIALAQTPVDLTTRSQLLEKEAALKQKAVASTNGASSVKLADYGNHFTMLSYRTKSGGAEVHAKFADFFYVIDGAATLSTGGKLVNPTQANNNPDESGGTAIEGGSEMPLHAGDIVHIHAGVPHQLILPSGGDFYYYVIKVREQ